MRGRPKGTTKRDYGGLTYNQWYNQNVRSKRLRATRRKDTETRCVFCGIFLVSSMAGSPHNRKYCTDCKSSKRIQKRLHAMYQRRAYKKRTGKTINTSYEMLYKYF